MLKKRIIPCLDIKDGRTVKGINFEQIRDAGDPIELGKLYSEQGADELVFLDITATVEKRKTLIELVTKISTNLNIPFTVGGGINTVEDVTALIKSGADKVSINSSAVKNPKLISEIALEFGVQCTVVAIDTKFENGDWWVYTHGGRTKTDIKTMDWVQQVQDLGAGELLLTSMNHDGTKNGFAIDLIQQVQELVNIPIIASGGAGSITDFVDLFSTTKATGALAASIFHYNEIPIPELKKELKKHNLPIR